MYYCFHVLRRIGEYIFLGLFYLSRRHDDTSYLNTPCPKTSRTLFFFFFFFFLLSPPFLYFSALSICLMHRNKLLFSCEGSLCSRWSVFIYIASWFTIHTNTYNCPIHQTVLCRCRASFALHRHKKTWWKRCCWHSNSPQYKTRRTRIAKLQQITSGTAKGSPAATHWEQIENDTSNELPAERTAETIAFSQNHKGLKQSVFDLHQTRICPHLGGPAAKFLSLDIPVVECINTYEPSGTRKNTLTV